MGCCASTNEVDQHMRKSKKNKERENFTTNKLLLLGAGESGKSTIFKQAEFLHGNGFQNKEAYRDIVFSHVITCSKVLCRNCKQHGKEVKEENMKAKEEILSLGPTSKVDGKTAALLKQIWKDPGIQLTYQNRAAFQIFDNADFFFERIDELAKPGYLPDESHIFRARVRTTGIVEMEFEVDENKYIMFDVGGQRNERKKWIHCFDGVTAVIFVAALSAYNQKLYEDKRTSRVSEALKLFEEVCKSAWFKKTAKILFLNKKDLFIRKIESGKDPLKNYFPEYKGQDDDVEASINFFKELFESCGSGSSGSPTIYTHVTTATDPDNMKFVLSSVNDIMYKLALTESGMTR
jgi:guanine nucleotide-binding protein subunit alpha